MAEETGKQPAAFLVLVVVEKEEQLQQVRTVRFVSYWALFNALIFAFSFAIDYTLSPLLHDHHNPAVEARYTIWFVVLQAAAASLAPLLAGDRRKTRLALAYGALTATAVCHCMFASVIGGYHAGGHLLLRIGGTLANFVFAGGDFFCLLALLFVSSEPGRSAHES